MMGMGKRAACIAAAGVTALGICWAACGGIADDPAMRAVREFYREMDAECEDGKIRLEQCAPIPKGSYWDAESYSGYPDWQAFQTLVRISDSDGSKAHHGTTVAVKDADSVWKVVSHGAG